MCKTNRLIFQFFSPYCVCNPMYNGTYCENALSPCSTVTCQNNGVCVIDQQYLKPYCLCQFGFTGLSCESSVNYCVNAPCINNGTCTSSGTGYTCQCQPGYAGQYNLRLKYILY